MLRNRVLLYDGSHASSEIIEADGPLRWAAWKRDGSEALIVGNKGTILSYSADQKSVRKIPSPVNANLRGVDFSPEGNLAVIVGNAGTVLIVTDSVKQVESITPSNLRKIAWKNDGSGALIVGNDGAAFFLAARGLRRVYGVANHLRSISWHPKDQYAVVVGNSVKSGLAGLVPAPGFYRFDTGSFSLTPLREISPETPKDLTSASWRPDGSQCIVVGYDQTWHTSELYTFDGKSVAVSDWKAENLLPTSFAWHPSGTYGLIVTGGWGGEGMGTILKYDDGAPKAVYKARRYLMSCVAWNPRGNHALILGSSRSRSFSA